MRSMNAIVLSVASKLGIAQKTTATIDLSICSGLLSVHLSYGNSYLRRDNFKACIVFVIIISSWLEQSSKRLLISAL